MHSSFTSCNCFSKTNILYLRFDCLGALKTKLKAIITARCFDKAILAIINDKINNIKIGSKETFGNRVKNIAESIYMLHQTERYEVVHKDLVTKMLTMFQERKNLIVDSELQILLKDVHVFSAEKSNYKEFKSIVNIECNEFVSMFHSTCINMMTEIVRMENETLKEPFVEANLTEEEQQVLRYSAGYIIFSLRRHYLQLIKIL